MASASITADGKAKIMQPTFEVFDEDPQPMIYSGISTESPRVKGNLGESPLLVVKRTPTEIELLERTSSGNIVMHSLFLTEKIGVMTKQYGLGAAPHAYLQMGKCW